MSGAMSLEAPNAARPYPPAFRWRHAALFWLLVNAPGYLFFPWREALFPGFRAPALRPPGDAFPVIWFVITVCALLAGLRILNDRAMRRRTVHLGLQGLFWAVYAVFPAFFFRHGQPDHGSIPHARHSRCGCGRVRDAMDG